MESEKQIKPVKASLKISTKSWVRDAGALFLLAAIVLIFFWPVVVSRAWIPHGGGDLVSFIYPMYRFAAGSLRGGDIPLWNPYLYAGAPLIGDNQSGVFYPFNLALFLLRPDFSYKAIEGLVIWHFFFAGAGMYACLRWLRPSTPIGRLASLTGALAFMLSDVFVTHIGNLNLIAVASWLPLAFVALHRGIDARNTRSQLAWAIGSGVALGTGTLAGHGQSTFLVASFLGFYVLFRAISDRNGKPLLLLTLVGIVTICTAAISLFPALESVQHTLRAEFSFERSTSYSLPWQGLTGLLAPNFFGRGAANFWGSWGRVEYGYIGVMPWFLATIAFIVRPSRRNISFLVASALFLLLAMGPNTPLYTLVFGRLPIVPFQVPARFVFLLNFSLAILAAIGLDYLCTTSIPANRSRFILVTTAVLTLLAAFMLVRQLDSFASASDRRQHQMLTAVWIFLLFAGGSWLLLLGQFTKKLPPSRFGWIVFLWLAVDLIGLGRYVEIEWNDPTRGYPQESPAMAFLKSDPGLHRIDIVAGRWQPSLPQIEKLYAIGGVFNPLHLMNYSVYIGSMGSRGSSLYNLLGVKYVIGGKSNPPGDTNFIIPVFEDDPDVTVYLNTRSLPRVMVLYEAQVVADHDAAFDAVHSRDFDPQRTLILEAGSPLIQPPGHSQINILRYDLNYAAFDVTTDQPAYFLLTDIDHPQWGATDNGEPVEILTADYAFRAIYLEPGTHFLEFRFNPLGWRVGLFTSSLAWLAIMVFVFWLWRDLTKGVKEPNDVTNREQNNIWGAILVAIFYL